MSAFRPRIHIYKVATLLIAGLTLEQSGSALVGVANRQSETAFAARQFQQTLQGRLASLNQPSSSQSAAPPAFFSPAGLCFDCARPDEPDEAVANARLNRRNRTGHAPGIDLLSQNFYWSTALLHSPGRAQLDLNLTLSYNSLVWTRTDSQLSFDADRGHPSPGFRLGFPTIQGRYRGDAGVWYYILITESGERVQLRRTPAPDVYESTDASVLELVDHGRDGAVLRRPSGSMLTFKWLSGQLQCTEVKDRNGNYLSMEYDDFGHLSQVTDTLGRVFTFERDAGGNLTSIIRTAGDARAVMATFGYDDLSVSAHSPLPMRGLTVGSDVKVLTHVGLKDGSSYRFAYTKLGQVWRIDKHAPDGHLLTYSSLNLPVSPVAVEDSPRASEVRTWVADADAPDATVVRVDVAPDHAWGRVTREDGSTRTEFFEIGGRHDGLVGRTELRDVAGVLTLTDQTTWRDIYRGDRFARTVRATHDVVWRAPSHGEDTKTTYDDLGMLAGMTTSKAGTITGHMQVAYNRTSAYVDRHILHLPDTVVTSGDAGEMTTTFEYDKAGGLLDQGVAVQHDRDHYGSTRTSSRGLVSTIRRRVGSRTTEQYRAYNATGTLAQLSDSNGRTIGLDYTDAFTDGRARNAWAFATTSWTDTGVVVSIYDLETGTAARTVAADGTATEVERDRAGRTIRTSNLRTGEVRRRVYSATGDATALFVKRPRWQGENALYTYYDGAGRSRAQLRGVSTRPDEFTGSRIERNAAGRRLGHSRPLTVARSQPTASSIAWIQSSWSRVQAVATTVGHLVSPTLYADCYWQFGYDTEFPEWVCDSGGGGGSYDPWVDNPFYASNTEFIQSLNSGDPGYDDPDLQSLQTQALFGHWGLPPVSGVQMVVSGESNDVWAFYGQGSDTLDRIILQLQAAGLDGSITQVSWDGGGFHATLAPWAIDYLSSLASIDQFFTTGPLFGFHQELLVPGTETISYRSYNETYGPGSLQLVVNTSTRDVHVDVDSFNPNQDLVSLFGHTFTEVLPDLFELRDSY